MGECECVSASMMGVTEALLLMCGMWCVCVRESDYVCVIIALSPGQCMNKSWCFLLCAYMHVLLEPFISF